MSERRYFTVEEANARVPWLAECFSLILQLRGQMRGIYQSLDRLGHRPDERNLGRSDGPEEVQVLRAKFRGLMEALQEQLSSIEEEGIEVKDIDTGLCDFWSVQDGEEIYLCWRYGERCIEYYHDPQAGFAGRKPLPKSAPKPRVLH